MTKKNKTIGFGATPEGPKTEPVKKQTRGPRRKKGELTPRDRKLIQGLLDGKSVRQAARAATFSNAMSDKASKILTPQVVEAITVEMERQGITDELLMRRLRRGLSAQVVKIATFEGKITDARKFRDFEQIRKYTELALELKGYLVKADNQQHQTVNILNITERKQRVIELLSTGAQRVAKC